MGKPWIDDPWVKNLGVDGVWDHIIHHHGGPLFPGKPDMLSALYRGTGAMVSFARPEQLKKIIRLAVSIWLDNGAFSVWKKSKNTNDVVDWDLWWAKYYAWVILNYDDIDHFIIPDVIEGSESDNDLLIENVPLQLRSKAVPVWHSDESLDKLVRLCRQFKIVSIGCCGDAKRIRSKAWKARMDEVFTLVYITLKLDVRLHGLRCMDGRALIQHPWYSVDSANVAINVPKTKARLPEVTCKLQRTSIMRNTIEMIHPPSIADWVAREVA